MKIATTSTTIILLVCFFGTTSSDPEVPQQTIIKSNKLFTSSIYQEISKIKPSENFIVSPLSVAIVLSLTQSGANGKTGEEIRAALSLPDTVEEDFKALLRNLKSDTVKTANKIYVKTGYSLREDYKKTAEDVYECSVQEIDFSPKAAETMNRWVEEQTEDRIKNLVDPQVLDESTRLVLINALYFKANWSNQFSTSESSKREFYGVECDFMQQESLFGYYESTEINARFLEIPFDSDDASLVIILPNDRDGIVDETQIGKVFDEVEFTREQVLVALPKFNISTETDFVDILKNLGVQEAFGGPEVDFSGIAGSPGDLYINNVLQKAFVDVNENGVEAAAATYIVGVYRAGKTENVKKFIVDHPFLFYIKMKDVILFFGKVVNPVAE